MHIQDKNELNEVDVPFVSFFFFHFSIHIYIYKRDDNLNGELTKDGKTSLL